MISILSPDGRPALDSLARHRALLVFGFDGVLAPGGPGSARAPLRPETRALLRAASVLYPCAVLSARPRAELAAALARIPLVAVVGNHGAEAGHGPVDRSLRWRVLAWRESLSRALCDAVGVEVEDRRFSLALQLRGAARRATARRRVVALASALPGARVLAGRAALDVVPVEAPGKAAAVEEIRRRAGAHHLLYVGSAGDEDVFRSSAAEVAIRIGRTCRSAAAHYLPSQRAVDDLLRALLTARTRLDGLGERWEGLARAVGA